MAESLSVSLPSRRTRVLCLWGRTERGLSLLVTLYVFSAWFIAHAYNRPEAFRGLLYVPISSKIFLLCLIPYIFARVLWIMIWWRPVSLISTIVKDLRETFLHPQRLTQSLPLLVIFLLFFGAFTGLKEMIPVLNPYSWDHTFATLDARFHGGVHPWQLLHTILGYPLVTSIINIAYNFWVPVMIFVFFWQALTLHLPHVRRQFLLTFFLSWIIIGNVLATIFSSAGPCYYAAITGLSETPYDGLMTYLREASAQYPVWAVKTQARLWQAYTEKKLVLGSGISAMPSMHVAVAFLMMLLARRWGKSYTFFLTLYFVIIFVGSIHLAWHYAVDAYFAVPLTYGIWRFSAVVVKRLDPTTFS